MKGNVCHNTPTLWCRMISSKNIVTIHFNRWSTCNVGTSIFNRVSLTVKIVLACVWSELPKASLIISISRNKLLILRWDAFSITRTRTCSIQIEQISKSTILNTINQTRLTDITVELTSLPHSLLTKPLFIRVEQTIVFSQRHINAGTMKPELA